MRKHGVDIAIAIVLFAVALLVRWPHLMMLPAFGDESLEVLWGFEIAMGKRLTLTGHDPYYGPIFPYLMAAGFRLFGFQLIVPRAVTAVFGALTVPLTFWFGRLVESRWTGILAAIMVATCPALVLYSHFGWSNSLTPFFATLSFACLYLGVERHQKTALAAGAFFVAVTMQTHPLTSVAFAGTALWIVRSRTRHPWLTWRELRTPAIFCVIGYSPMLLENIIRPLITFRVALIRTYAFVPTMNPHAYVARLFDLTRTLLDMLAGGLAYDHFPAGPITLALIAVLLTAVVVLDVSRGNRLFSYALSATALIMPIFVKLYIPRYIAFLIPLAFVTAASVIIRSIRQVLHSEAAESFRNAARSTGLTKATRWSGLVLAGAALIAAQLSSIESMRRYNNWAFANNMTNDVYFRLLAAIQQTHACGPHLFIEDVGFPFANPAWVGLYAVDYMLTLSGCEHRLLTIEKTRPALAEAGAAWALMSNATGGAWPGQSHLEPAFVLKAPTGPDLIPITLYRVTPGQPPSLNSR